MWLHRGRTAAVVLAIVVGLAGAGAVLDAWALLRKVTHDEYLATNPASATLHMDSVDAALLAAVRALPDVRDAQARRTVTVGVRVNGAWGTGLLYASNELRDQRIGKLIYDRGQWPPANSALVMESSSVAFSGASIGDSVIVRVGSGAEQHLPVTGIVRDEGLAPGWMDHVVYGFVTPATLAQLGVPASLDELQFTVRDRALDRDAIRRVAATVHGVAVRSGHVVTSIDVPVPGRHVHAAQMDSFLMVMGAFGILALFMSGFLVVNLLTATLTGQLREIGVMKALGARPAQLAAMYLVFALALGVLASAIAIPVAALGGRAYASFAATMLNFDVAGYAIPRYAIALQLLAGMLLPVLAALVPVARGCRIDVASALRDVGIGGATAPWIERIRGTQRPLLFSLRNAFRRKWRTALTLTTLSFGGAVFLGALDLRVSIRSSVASLFDDLLRFDMTIRLDAPHAADSVDAVVARIPGVERAEEWGGVRVTRAAGGELAAPFAVTAVPGGTQLIALPLVRGRWLRNDDAPEIVVNTRMLEEQPQLQVGALVDLAIGGRTSRWTVVGLVASAGPPPEAFVTRAALAHVTGDARVTTLLIRARDRDVAAQSGLVSLVRDALEANGFAVGSSQLMQASRRAFEDHLLMVGAFLLAMAQLTVIVGALALGSTMSLAVQERTREIGVLRAIGATPRAIVRMVQAEGLLIAILSWLIAIPLSLPMSVLLARSFGRILLPVTSTLIPEWSAVSIWFGVAVLVSLAAGAWPAIRATRIPTVAALAYE
ncbi:MAG TPA: FtsX-like permease family protein [Gemmatimonadaceae bacterium]|nr:FtsX-like permease family protein [Gemmatimonadaceae bacterium]